MHFREAVVETELTVLEPVIGFIASLISQRPDLFRNDRIAGDNHSTFTGGDLLVGVESKNSGISQSADFAALKLSSNCFARVFNEQQTMTPRNGEKRIHVRWIPEGVNGHDGSSLVRDRRFSPLWIQVESDRININKDGICAHVTNRIGYSDE